jgi:hypothetical protein
LKPNTIHHILRLLAEGKSEALPPAPILRRLNKVQLVAVDGHNLLAVMAFLGRTCEVHIATSPTNGIADDSNASESRNKDLAVKFDSAIDDSIHVSAQGLPTIDSLVNANLELFVVA